MTDKRTFKIASARQAGTKERGCKTKFQDNLIYRSARPESAAKKAFNSLCSRKRIKGVCSMFITVKEITRGSKGKSYTYQCRKTLLRGKNAKKVDLDGVLVTFKYKITARAVKKEIKNVAKVCKQSRGRMLGNRNTPKKK